MKNSLRSVVHPKRQKNITLWKHVQKKIDSRPMKNVFITNCSKTLPCENMSIVQQRLTLDFFSLFVHPKRQKDITLWKQVEQTTNSSKKHNIPSENMSNSYLSDWSNLDSSIIHLTYINWLLIKLIQFIFIWDKFQRWKRIGTACWLRVQNFSDLLWSIIINWSSSPMIFTDQSSSSMLIFTDQLYITILAHLLPWPSLII